MKLGVNFVYIFDMFLGVFHEKSIWAIIEMHFNALYGVYGASRVFWKLREFFEFGPMAARRTQR